MFVLKSSSNLAPKFTSEQETYHVFCVLHSVHGSLGKYLLNELAHYVLSILSAHVRQVKSKTGWGIYPVHVLYSRIMIPTDTFRGIVDTSLELLHSTECFYFEILTF